MLTFLTGTYFPSKKKYISEKIAELLKNGEKVFLIVPEQSSFDRDRDFLFEYGEKLRNLLTVTSFTHLSRDVLEEYGFSVKPQADEAVKNVLMSLAVEECDGETDMYSKSASKNSSVAKLLAGYGEIRAAGLSTEELFSVSSLLSDGTLKQKTKELALIFSTYEALLSERFSDSADNIAAMTRFLEKNNVFENAYLFFDDFRGFTGAQIKLIEVISSQAKEIYVSVLSQDSVNAYGSGASEHAVANCRKIRAAVAKNSIQCREIKIESVHPNETLNVLNGSLFCIEKDVYDKECDCVSVIKADNKYDECDIVALEIKKLLQDGYRCEDIYVCERGSKYMKPLAAAMKKYGIPVFEDKRVLLSEYPLVRMIVSAVFTASHSFDSEQVFSYLKTGITGITDEECAMLENYVYIWQIDKNAWLKPFTAHPDGLGEAENESSVERLQKLEELRKNAIEPLLELKKRLSDADGGKSCKAVYEFLTDISAAENFKKYATSLYDADNEAAAMECARVWDYVMQALDALYETVEKRQMTPQRFYELLKITLTSGDIGRIPAGIDEIVIGEAVRTRHLEPKVVFVLGCNEGIFPRPPVSSGIFTTAQKRLLGNTGFSLEGVPENLYAEERMAAYSVLSNASDKLFVSYCVNLSDGSMGTPSEIISEILQIVPKCRMISSENISPLERIGSDESAFEQCAEHFSDNTVFSESLKRYIEQSKFASSFSVLSKASKNVRAEIQDRDVATQLFGKDMNISPSKSEMFYTCAFKYFCRYGLNVKKLTVADYDARVNGLLIHYLLEQMLRLHTNKELTLMSQESVIKEVDVLTETFINEYMGGREDKSVLMNRSLDKVKETALGILSRLKSEFSESDFETVDVELGIGEKREIPPYKIMLSDSGSITIGGQVDRVDIMKTEATNYFRIVDYKTGGKEFKDQDVRNGLNMQMLIYLMCIWSGGKERYGDLTPAGILYLPAHMHGEMLGRHANEEKIIQQRYKNGRMNGLVLDDEKVLNGMENGCQGKYLNASIGLDGKKEGKFKSLDEFHSLHIVIDKLLRLMGDELHSGNIAAYPIEKYSTYSPCKYCDYKDICRREEDSEVKEYVEFGVVNSDLLGGKKGSKNDG